MGLYPPRKRGCNRLQRPRGLRKPNVMSFLGWSVLVGGHFPVTQKQTDINSAYVGPLVQGRARNRHQFMAHSFRKQGEKSSPPSSRPLERRVDNTPNSPKMEHVSIHAHRGQGALPLGRGVSSKGGRGILRNRALMATITVESDIRMAPAAGERAIPWL